MDDFPPLFLKTDPKSVKERLGESEAHVVLCYNVPPHVQAPQLERILQCELAPNTPSGKLSITHVVPPATFETQVEQPWKLLCGDKASAEQLVGRVSLSITVEKESFLSKIDEAKTTVTIFFEAGSFLDVPHHLLSPNTPAQHSQSAAGGRLVKQKSATSRLPANIGELLKEYMLSSKIKPLNSLGQSASATLFHSSRFRPQCRDALSSGPSFGMRDWDWSTVTEFPSDVLIQRVPDYVKEKFCVVCRNKPDGWKARDLEDFLHDFFREKAVSLKIASIFSTISRPRMATIACRDEASRREMLRFPRIPLQPDCAAVCGSSCLELQPFLRRAQSATSRGEAGHALGQFEHQNSGLSSGGAPQKGLNAGTATDFVYHRSMDPTEPSVQLHLCMVVQNKPVSWTKEEVTDFLNSYFQTAVRDKLKSYGTQNGVVLTYPCTNSKIAFVYCSSESVRNAFVAERTVRLPSPPDESGRSVSPEYIELVPWRDLN